MAACEALFICFHIMYVFLTPAWCYNHVIDMYVRTQQGTACAVCYIYNHCKLGPYFPLCETIKRRQLSESLGYIALDWIHYNCAFTISTSLSEIQRMKLLLTLALVTILVQQAVSLDGHGKSLIIMYSSWPGLSPDMVCLQCTCTAIGLAIQICNNSCAARGCDYGYLSNGFTKCNCGGCRAQEEGSMWNEGTLAMDSCMTRIYMYNYGLSLTNQV